MFHATGSPGREAKAVIVSFAGQNSVFGTTRRRRSSEGSTEVELCRAGKHGFRFQLLHAVLT